jgi:FKBP-type peptidyl-prolyl cis-trans isomerase
MMKALAAILAASFALASFGCGEEDPAAMTTQAPKATTTTAEQAGPKLILVSGNDPRVGTVTPGESWRAEPTIDPPDRAQVPKLLLGRDLKVGSGSVANLGDVVTVRFVGVDYKSGKISFTGWGRKAALEFELGTNGNGEGFETGMVGMRVGGRRELVIPSRLSFGAKPLIYVVELAGTHASRLLPGETERER